MASVRVCSREDVPEGEARRFGIEGREIAVVNLGGKGFRALDAVCSHERFFLDEGEVDAEMGTIECPKHGSTFDLETGQPRTLPAIRPVAAYPVTEDGDDIWIQI
jgi:3-phenylpropionate/trans-cinnamate dioxygenase ferredoxin subunit